MLSYFARRSFGPWVVNVATDIPDNQGDNYRGSPRRHEGIYIAYGLNLAGPTVQLFTLTLFRMIPYLQLSCSVLLNNFAVILYFFLCCTFFYPGMSNLNNHFQKSKFHVLYLSKQSIKIQKLKKGMYKAFYKQSVTQNYILVSSHKVCLLYITIALSGTANTGCVF